MARTVRRLLLASTLALAACSSDPDPTQSLSPSVPSSTATVRLNEIRFLAAADAPAFVELLNFGSDDVSLDGAVLRTGAGESPLLPSGLVVGPGEFLVVSFDDQQGTTDGAVHLPAVSFAGGESGRIALQLPDGIADIVIWGEPSLSAASLCRGGRCAQPAPASVLARVPGEQTAFMPTAWALLDAVLATPGTPNPRPPVTEFAAIPGMIFADAPIFSWYSVPGAARYRLEVARDETFAALVYEADVDGTPGARLEQLTAPGPELPPGDYAWRVQARGAAGDAEAAAYSPPVPFSTVAPSRVPEGSLKVLDVPVIKHAKDTEMLVLEAWSEESPGSWDTPDVAGYPYCARAGVAMVNAFYRAQLAVPGKLSQDRIAYETFKGLREGPEFDLPVFGISDDNTSEHSLPLAIGTQGQLNINVDYDTRGAVTACSQWEIEQTQAACASQCVDPMTEGCVQCQIAFERNLVCPGEIRYRSGARIIADIQREIDAGRPLMATTSGHLFLIVGYRLADGRFTFFYQDAGGRREVRANAEGLTRYLVSYWMGLAPVSVGNDEPEVSADFDDDGVVDFDEIHRFATDEHDPDSDDDGLTDKTEIEASVWDPQHGYHRSAPAESPDTAGEQRALAASVDLAGRDLDRDGVAMEMDVDSDGGGCRDGVEDEDRNGARNAAETYNFDANDDACEVALGGRIDLRYAFVPGRRASCFGYVDIRLRFELEPDWTGVPEDARTVARTYQARQAEYEISTEGCEDIVGGSFDFWGGANVACNARAARKSGVVALGEESNSYLMFFPLDPQLGLLLPADSLLTLAEQCMYVDGRSSDSEIGLVGSEAFTIGSGPYCETSDRYEYGQGPNLLAFCVEPTVCNSMGPQNVPECYAAPERYAVIPFSGSATKRGEILDASRLDGEPFSIPTDGPQVRWEICNGCGDRFFD